MMGRLPEACCASKPTATDAMTAVLRNSRRDQVMCLPREEREGYHALGRLRGRGTRPTEGQLRSPRNAAGCVLIGTETEQGTDVSHAIEFRLISHIDQLNIAADGHRNNCLADVFEFPRAAPAYRTEPHDVCVQVSAVCTLDGAGAVILIKQ